MNFKTFSQKHAVTARDEVQQEIKSPLRESLNKKEKVKKKGDSLQRPEYNPRNRKEKKIAA